MAKAEKPPFGMDETPARSLEQEERTDGDAKPPVLEAVEDRTNEHVANVQHSSSELELLARSTDGALVAPSVLEVRATLVRPARPRARARASPPRSEPNTLSLPRSATRV